MKNADEPDVDLPECLPDAAHEAWFLSDENLPFMGNVTRRQSRFVWRAARRDADAEIKRLTASAMETPVEPSDLLLRLCDLNTQCVLRSHEQAWWELHREYEKLFSQALETMKAAHFMGLWADLVEVAGKAGHQQRNGENGGDFIKRLVMRSSTELRQQS